MNMDESIVEHIYYHENDSKDNCTKKICWQDYDKGFSRQNYSIKNEKGL